MNANIGGNERVGTNEVLLAELQIFEEAMWRSEDTGEKRFNFFVTLLTAAAAGLVALWGATSLSDPVKNRLDEISAYVSGALLLFGLLTLMRMKQRDRVTAQYKRSTWFIRDLYRAANPELRCLRLPRPVNPSDARRAGYNEESRGRPGTRWDRFRKGGYTISLGFINGILLATTLMFACSWNDAWIIVPPLAGLIFAGLLCWYGSEPFPSWEETRPGWPPT